MLAREKTQFLVERPEQYQLILPTLLDKAGGNRIWCFQGEMGTGKTTMINALCSHLGVTTLTNSPTYAIIQEYPLANHEVIFHMDLFRIRTWEELVNTGIEDILDTQGAWFFIEWPELLIPQLRESYVTIELKTNPDSSRCVIFSVVNPR